MKKILFLMITFITVLSIGCQKKTIQLKTTKMTLHHGDSCQIVAESNSTILYHSSDEFHASVNTSGMVRGNFVGKAVISLKNDHDEKKCSVTVAPKYFLYPEPDITFGESRSSIIQRFGTPDIDQGSAIGYKDYGLIGFNLAIAFDDNNMVESYAVTVPIIYNDILADFIGERYLFLGTHEDLLLFVNGSPETATMGVALNLHDTSYWIVLYYPLKSSSKGIVVDTGLISELEKLFK